MHTILRLHEIFLFFSRNEFWITFPPNSIWVLVPATLVPSVWFVLLLETVGWQFPNYRQLRSRRFHDCCSNYLMALNCEDKKLNDYYHYDFLKIFFTLFSWMNQSRLQAVVAVFAIPVSSLDNIRSIGYTMHAPSFPQSTSQFACKFHFVSTRSGHEWLPWNMVLGSLFDLTWPIEQWLDIDSDCKPSNF